MIVIILAIFAVVNAEDIVKVSLGSVGGTVADGSNLPEKYQPLLPNDVTATDSARKWWENLVANAATGTGNIPVLDPFFKDELPPISIDHSLITGELKLKNVNITGIKNIDLENLEVRAKNNRLDVVVSAPVLTGEADYEADINLGFLPITYTGHANLLLKGVKLTGAANTLRKRYKGAVVYQLDGIQATIHVDDVVIDIEKTLWDTVTGVMSTSQIFEEGSKAGTSAFRTQANIILREYPVKSVQKYLRVMSRH
ncbi:uncharacterized protein LOC128670066 [Plodia interpunctella]|uniref:uncharacterized protein LOC128670066 n=1 Tax=Plodia interpunctella TaxID=58824 RepID=UPI00236850B5|nr:uncharacterized protein LOC128670066 [Plodia interpunctella]